MLGCTGGRNGYIEGSQYNVTWALGHLVTLADPDAYDKKWEKWDMAELPMLPEQMKLTVIPESRKQYQTVAGLLKRPEVTELVIATDAGRCVQWVLPHSSFFRGMKMRKCTMKCLFFKKDSCQPLLD